jgi:ribosomal-protein-alanine N-acetyltransferase
MSAAAVRHPAGRVRLRPLAAADRDAFVAMHGDPDVMATLLGPLDRRASDALFDRLRSDHASRGWGLLAVEADGLQGFAGLAGLLPVPADVPCSPSVEVAWRLRRAAWGLGIATEAARLAISDGFGRLGVDEIVAYTAAANARSLAVIGRLGFRRDPSGDFDHPRVPEGDPLRPHQLYRMGRAQWQP